MGKERRQAIAVRLEGGTVLANLHATNARDVRLPEAEVERAAQWAGRLAGDDVCVVAGDLNVDTKRSQVFGRLAGFSAAGLASTTSSFAAPKSVSTIPGPASAGSSESLLLSDHTPVEVRIL